MIPVLAIGFATVVISAVALAAMRVIAASRSREVQGAAMVLVAGAFLGLPFAIETLVAIGLNQPHQSFYELRLPYLLLPMAAALFLAWRFQSREPNLELRRALILWAWCGLFGGFNTHNACSPGYCGSYGFPIPFYTWSDSGMIGKSLQPFSPAALVIDTVVFLAVTIVILRAGGSRREVAPADPS